MNDLPWSERVAMLSINPDARGKDDIARLSAELMDTCQKLTKLEDVYKQFSHLDHLLSDEKWIDESNPIHRTCHSLWLAVKEAVK